MALARFVVIEGPDVGAELPLPLRGGAIGRGEDTLVHLSDLSVSRVHCTIELRGGKLALIDNGSRNRTLVNGNAIKEHVLCEGDEVTIGKTRLAFLPSESASALINNVPAKLTMEIGSRDVFALRPGSNASDDRAQRHLASIANLGDALHTIADREQLGRTSCEAARSALAADRALLFSRAAGGRLVLASASVTNGQSAELAVPTDVVGKVLGEGKSVAAQGISIGDRIRDMVAAPLWSTENTPTGLLWIDRETATAFDRTDVMAAGCLAHLVSAALSSFDAQAALALENRELEAQVGGREFIGTSAPAASVLAFVKKVGPSDATVLLTGESGSGKEMVARAVHKSSRRSKAPFIAVNCAALTESLIESELFGHEKGAFTGASERKLGRFELADKGTLFLDEVGELPLGCQTKFLRVLEEQCFERVGGGKTIYVDVRVVAATNRDLEAMVRNGTFREDLYYRLSVIYTTVPPLRDRPQDIPDLCEYFLSRLKHQVSRRIRGFSAEAMAALTTYSWPGNVRELKNAVERAIVLGDAAEIQKSDLPPNIVHLEVGPSAPRANPPVSAASTTPTASTVSARPLKDLEREGIIAALRATDGNKAQAAQVLEIDRSTLYKKIKDYDIDV